MPSSIRAAVWTLLAVLLLISAAQVRAQDLVERNGLLISDNGVFKQAKFTAKELNSPGMLCIRFNNYWCMKSVGWEGEVGKDARGHAIFNDPVFSARAVARQFRTWWFRDGKRTAFQIMSTYAPPDDCVGSVGKPPNCKYGPNPTEIYAARVAESIRKGPNDSLDLFDASGKLNRSLAIPFFQAIASFELTEKYKVSPELIALGIDRAGL